MFVLALEGGLRWTAPYGDFQAGLELDFRTGSADRSTLFMIDPAFGFRPVLGNGVYSEFGTLANGYTAMRREGVRRILFIGDSVTARGRIIAALRRIYGDEGREYWNAGVESFNVLQEVEYYRRYNSALHPDHVVLTFHNNDFESTPVVFRNRAGKLVVYAPNRPGGQIWSWLFCYSYTYRIYLGLTRNPEQEIKDRAADVYAALRTLRDMLRVEGVRLTVVVHPVLKPYDEWRPAERDSRDTVLRYLTELGIAHLDLQPVTEQALRDGVQVRESPTDVWHPGDAAAEVMARYLADQRLLDENAGE
jgi:hypothetical protein